MGMSANHGPARDKKEMIKLLHKAVDLGYSYFDTAEVYGPHTNEELLGEALKGYKDKIIINTKFGFYYPFGKQQLDSSRKSIMRAIDGSLKRLQRDCIDLYTQHRVDIDTPIEEVAETMKDLVKMGKIKAWALGEAGIKTIKSAQSLCPCGNAESILYGIPRIRKQWHNGHLREVRNRYCRLFSA